MRAPWPVMGSKCEQLLARMANLTYAARELPEDEWMKLQSEGERLLIEVDEYLAGIGQFVDRMHARDMGERA